MMMMMVMLMVKMTKIIMTTIKIFIVPTINWQLVSTDDDNGDDLFTTNIPV